MSPDRQRARRDGVVALAVAAALAAVTVAVVRDERGASSLARHAYLVPVMVASLHGGLRSGTIVAGASILLAAPMVLPEIERRGLTAAAAEGLVSLAVVGTVGALVGAVTTRARRELARYDALVAVRKAVAGAQSLEEALCRLRAVLEHHLDAAVGIVAREGDRVVVSGGARVVPGSPVDRVLAERRPLFVADAGDTSRPRRAFVTPLVAEVEVIGALAVEREGEIGAGERAALTALGAHVGVALENARLAARQERFAQELGEKVASATERLEAIDRTKSAFVAVASHELRTPLTALQGFSELLALRRLPSEEVARFGRIMHGEARRLARIVSDLLDLSRIEQGLAPTLDRATVDLGALVADIGEVMRRAAPRHPIEIDCPTDLPLIDADPDALERILMNLMGNAVKYSHAGSPIQVRVRATGPEVALSVEDRGCGIPVHEQARVFEAYYRAADAARLARGAGIGLAVVRALVEAHRGTIHLDSVPGGGTRATVTLPALS